VLLVEEVFTTFAYDRSERRALQTPHCAHAGPEDVGNLVAL
jgi:hypothetical protein